jgi:hypothetical protein
MREWFDAQLAAGLPAFAGTTMSGTVAVKQELLNELLAGWLNNGNPGRAAVPVDLDRLKTFVKRAAVRAEAGTVLVDFTVAV